MGCRPLRYFQSMKLPGNRKPKPYLGAASPGGRRWVKLSM